MKRKSNRAFFRYLFFGLEILLMWVLQSTPKLMPEILGSRPFLLLAAALSFAACSKAAPAVILGAVCGALSDISANGTIGYFSVAFTLVCYASAMLLDTYLNRNALTSAVLAFGSIAAVLLLYFLFFRVFAGVPDCGALFVRHYLSRIGYTTLTFFPLYFLNRFLVDFFKSR